MSRNKVDEIQIPDSFLYGLAHYVVRRLFFSGPRKFYRLVDAEWDLGFGDYIWKQALPFAEPDADWDDQRWEFAAMPVSVGGCRAMLVLFPAPEEQTLCHMTLDGFIRAVEERIKLQPESPSPGLE